MGGPAIEVGRKLCEVVLDDGLSRWDGLHFARRRCPFGGQ